MWLPRKCFIIETVIFWRIGMGIGIESVRPGFPTITLKSNLSINFKFGVHICWVGVQNWFAFWAMLARFWLSRGQKLTENGSKYWFPTIVKKKNIHTIQFKLVVYIFWVSVQNLICLWATLAKFWPPSGHKMTENGAFLPSSEKVFIQCNSNLVCTLIKWVARIDSILGPHWPSFGTLVGTKWLNMVVSDHYLKKVFMKSNPNLVCTLTGWVFRIDSFLGHVDQILAL